MKAKNNMDKPNTKEMAHKQNNLIYSLWTEWWALLFMNHNEKQI